jgi:hypothetical protein
MLEEKPWVNSYEHVGNFEENVCMIDTHVGTKELEWLGNRRHGAGRLANLIPEVASHNSVSEIQ